MKARFNIDLNRHGSPSFIAGLNLHCRTASMALSSSPRPTACVTLIFCGIPPASTTSYRTQTPSYPAWRACSENSGSGMYVARGALTP